LRTSLLVALLVAFALPPSAQARSALRLESFGKHGVRRASLFDPSGAPIGRSRVGFEPAPEGRVRMSVRSSLDAGGGAEMEALLAPRSDGGLELLSEHTRTLAADGRPALIARIDHAAGTALCERRGEEPVRLSLPADQRIANVVLPILLLPLARSEVDEVDFQFLLCRATPRIVDARARHSRRLGGAQGGRGVELAARFDLGPILNLLAGPFLPELRVWLDPDAEPPWLGHLMPLYPGGPSVATVREGVELEWLLGETSPR
jgi:hypothetical protein